VIDSLPFQPHDEQELSRHLSRKVVRRIWEFARPQRRWILAFLAASVVAALLAALPALVLRRLVDVAIPSGNGTLVNLLAAAIAGITLGIGVVNLLGRWAAARAGEELTFNLRLTLFEVIGKSPMEFFVHSHTGALSSRIGVDVMGAQRVATDTMGVLLSNSIKAFTILGAMVFLDWRLALLVVAIVPLFALPLRSMARRLHSLSHHQLGQFAAMNSLVTERFQAPGALLAKLSGGGSQDRMDFARSAGKVRDTGIRMALVLAGFMVLLSSLAGTGNSVVYWVGARLVISGGLSLGTVIAFSAYATQLYSVVVDLASVRAGLVTGLVSFERVFEVLDFCEERKDLGGSRELLAPRGEVEFQNVWFRYPAPHQSSLPSLFAGPPSDAEANAFALRGVSFKVRPGQTLALVGPSGSGKTTVGLLVAGIHLPNEGIVRIDGLEVEDLKPETLSGTVGVVSQDPHLFHDTLANNLRYGLPDASDEDLVQACEAARIHDLIESLPEGYDTVVGDRGYRLSGGEKQRVAIARVLLRDPAVVLLDEATSHLDPTSEFLVRTAISEALAGRTAIVIAHRLSTIEGADSVLVMRDGEVQQYGSPETLMTSEGLFKELFGSSPRARSESHDTKSSRELTV
jgi:ATP-binding cassette subfamily B protein